MAWWPRQTPRTGGEENAVRAQRPDLIDGHLVVADDPDLRLQLADKLVEVVGKTVVVVNQKDHSSASWASSSALSAARALFKHS